jgi:hypothetical protein
MTCRRPDAGRAILVRGDRDWLARIFAITTRHDIDVAEDVATAIWDTLPTDPALPGYKAYPLQFCRRCATTAVKRMAAAGLHEPGIYNYDRLARGEYGKKVKGAEQPEMKRLVEQAINSLVHTEERAAELAADGLTLCRHWNEDEQQWAAYVTANPELIAEDEVKVGERVFPPNRLPGDPPGQVWWGA